MCYFYKLIKTQKQPNLFNLIHPKLNSLRHPSTYSAMRCRKDYLKNSFIPYVVRKWNRLSPEIRNSTSCQEFRKSLLSFITLTCSSLFSIHHAVGVKLLVRLFCSSSVSLKQLRTTFYTATTSLPLVWLL